MLTPRRQPGDRRWFPAEFPLTDSWGLFVPVDRRRLPNRRRMNNHLVGMTAAPYPVHKGPITAGNLPFDVP